jgi:hypothetical protein
METTLSEFSIYTLLHAGKLDEAFKTGGSGTFQENSRWATGERLFREAQRSGRRMPILFSDAATTGGLIYYALLTDIEAGEVGSEKTIYSFEGLTKLDATPPKSALVKRSDGRPLSDTDIYPYRVVFTPSFLTG